MDECGVQVRAGGAGTDCLDAWSRAQFVAHGLDDVEVASASHRDVPLAVGLDEPPCAGDKPWHRHAFHECAALDPALDDVCDPRIDLGEERLETAEDAGLDDRV